MSTESRHEVQQWLIAYMDNYQRLPENAQYLQAFARHRGVHLLYRRVRETLSSWCRGTYHAEPLTAQGHDDGTAVKTQQVEPHESTRSLCSPSSSAPVLRRLRSETKRPSIDGSIRPTRRAASAPRSLHQVTRSSSIEPGSPRANQPAGAENLQDVACGRLSACVLWHTYGTVARQLLAKEAALSVQKCMQEFGRNLQHESSDSASCPATCLICLEFTTCVRSADRLCIEGGCQGWFCVDCLENYFTGVIRETPFAVPSLRCPSCKTFVPPSCWQKHVNVEVREAWQKHAQDLLSLRCGDCDVPGSLLLPCSAADSREALARTAFGEDQAAAEQVVQKWHDFETGRKSAAELLDALLDMWHPGHPEVNADGILQEKTQDRFEAAAQLIEDDGLRAVLQLHALKQFPKIRSRCCKADHCFRCKVATHHEDLSCEEVQRRQIPQDLEGSVQFCPGRASTRFLGCLHVTQAASIHIYMYTSIYKRTYIGGEA